MALDPDQLSEPARRSVERMEQAGGFASAISIWELGIKVKRAKLVLPLGVDELAQRIERSGMVQLLPVDTGIWLRSLSLAWEHPDLADRVIVATGLLRDLPLLTKDATIYQGSGVTCVW